jgi:hypothetical protein
MCSFVTCTYRTNMDRTWITKSRGTGDTITGVESLWDWQLVTAEQSMVKSDALVRCARIIASTHPIMNT